FLAVVDSADEGIDRLLSATVYDLDADRIVCRLPSVKVASREYASEILTFAPNGKSLFFGLTTRFERFEVPSGKSIAKLGKAAYQQTIFGFGPQNASADGTRLVFLPSPSKITEPARAELFDTTTGATLGVFALAHGHAQACLSPDGKRLATGG